MSDVENVGAKSLCCGVFGLSYILFFAGFACDAVYQVRALAGNVMLASVLDGCCSAFVDVQSNLDPMSLSRCK